MPPGPVHAVLCLPCASSPRPHQHRHGACSELPMKSGLLFSGARCATQGSHHDSLHLLAFSGVHCKEGQRLTHPLKAPGGTSWPSPVVRPLLPGSPESFTPVSLAFWHCSPLIPASHLSPPSPLFPLPCRPLGAGLPGPAQLCLLVDALAAPLGPSPTPRVARRKGKRALGFVRHTSGCTSPRWPGPEVFLQEGSRSSMRGFFLRGVTG